MNLYLIEVSIQLRKDCLAPLAGHRGPGLANGLVALKFGQSRTPLAVEVPKIWARSFGICSYINTNARSMHDLTSFHCFDAPDDPWKMEHRGQPGVILIEAGRPKQSISTFCLWNYIVSMLWYLVTWFVDGTQGWYLSSISSPAWVSQMTQLNDWTIEMGGIQSGWGGSRSPDYAHSTGESRCHDPRKY